MVFIEATNIKKFDSGYLSSEVLVLDFLLITRCDASLSDLLDGIGYE
jgi:hypothetical protein